MAPLRCKSCDGALSCEGAKETNAVPGSKFFLNPGSRLGRFKE